MKNKKTILLLALATVTSIGTAKIAQAAVPTNAIVPGSYVGHGHWRDSTGGAGDYTVTTEASAEQVASKYVFSAEQSFSVSVGLSKASEGFYDVRMGGVKTGSAYCLAIQCHWSITGAEGPVEETLTFYEGKLYKLGSKKVGAKTISWVESLDKK